MKKANHLLWLITVFIISRCLFFAVGVRFDASPLEDFLQFIDLPLLKERLLESIFFLHSQPPLFNLFLGIMIKIFPQHYAQAFHGVYLIVGLLFFLSLFSLMKRLGIRDTLAFWCTVLFMMSPAVILYENWLFYSYPVAAILCFSALFLHRFVEKFRFSDGLVFFALLAALALIRSVFHLYWFLIILSWLVLSYHQQWKKVVLTALIPFLCAGLVYLKNFIIFGTFSVSAVFLNAQLAQVTILGFTDKEINALVQDNKISLLTFKEIGTGFYDIGRYYQEYLDVKLTGIPVLDQHIKSSGYPNYNSLLSLMTSQYYRDDALSVLRYDRRGYWRAVKQACQMYFFPGPTDVVLNNRKWIRDYEDIYYFPFYHLNQLNGRHLYERLLWHLYGFHQIQWDGISRVWFFSVVLTYLVVIGFAGYFLIRHSRQGEGPQACCMTLLFICFNIVYNFIGHNFLIFLGNNRYRFDVDAFYLVLFAFCLNALIVKRKPIS